MIAWIAIVAPCLAEPHEGTWIADESVVAIERLHREAVQESLAGLPWLTRIFARPALERAAWSCGTLGLERDETHLTVVCDDKAPVRVPLDGTPARGDGPSGLAYQVQMAELAGDRALRFENELGVRWTSFHADGDRVVCRRRVESASLPIPLEWEVAYRPVSPSE